MSGEEGSSRSSYHLVPMTVEEGGLIPIRGEDIFLGVREVAVQERREESVDLNDLLTIPMSGIQVGIHHFSDDVVVEGPYPLSPSFTLIEIPDKPPGLENQDLIPVPAPRVHGQCAVWSKGCPDSSYCSPYHASCSMSYNPYHTPIPAEKGLLNCT